MQRRCSDAELSKHAPQGLLSDRKLSELVGQRLSELGHMSVALAAIFKQLQARLQVQVDGTRAASEPLGQNLSADLQGEVVSG